MTLIEAIVLSNTLGVWLGSLHDAPPNFVKHRPEKVTQPAPANRLLYASSLAQCRAYFNGLVEDRRPYVVLLNASTTELLEYGIPLHKSGSSKFGLEDLRKFLATEKRWNRQHLEKVRDLPLEVLKANNRDSILQRIQTNVYRIKDADERTILQRNIYAFLSGKTKTPPSKYKFIENILRSEVATRLRRAVQRAKQSDDVDAAAAEENLDRFEVAYVLSKCSN